MTLEQALATGLPIYAEYEDATLVINNDGSLYVGRELLNGKIRFDGYYDYERARREYPLDKLNWNV